MTQTLPGFRSQDRMIENQFIHGFAKSKPNLDRFNTGSAGWDSSSADQIAALESTRFWTKIWWFIQNYVDISFSFDILKWIMHTRPHPKAGLFKKGAMSSQPYCLPTRLVVFGSIKNHFCWSFYVDILKALNSYSMKNMPAKNQFNDANIF